MTERTLKIEDAHIDFIRLVLRSPDEGDGWRSVSKMLRNFATKMVEDAPQLYETKEEDGKLSVRLSEEGLVLGKYA